jgi:2',3'-cyclic-nucleotide 2'-phosphodiesterase (5'-nucleotidase family)
MRLAEESKGIDLILGGHDHTYVQYSVNGIMIKKSGTNFREFTVIRMEERDKRDDDFCFNEESKRAWNYE